MSTTLLIAARDVREKGPLFLIAAVLACMPFLATLLPTSRGHSQDVIAFLGGFIGVTAGLGLALGLGITTFGRELSEKRLSFWYAKPIDPAALWIGRAAAALFSAIACFAIIVVPAMLASGKAWHVRWLDEEWQVPLSVLVAMIVLFLVGHAASTMMRSRSALLGVDLLAAIIAFAVLAFVVRPLLFTEIFFPFLIAVAALFVVVLAGAPYWQLANGRTDVRRSHAALSRALWTGVAIVLTLATGLVLWLVSGTPASFDRVVSIDQAPGGNAVFIAGSAPYRRGVDATFALNPATGESDRIAVPAHWGVSFSRDSRFAAWVEPGTFNWSRGEIVVRDLAKNENVPLGFQTNLGARIALSDDGSRLAVRDGATLSIIARETGKLVAATHLDSMPETCWFVTPDLVRMVVHRTVGRREGAPLEISELDLRTKQLTVTGRTMALPSYNDFSVSGDGSRMFLRADRIIADGRTGATIARLPKGEGRPFATAMLNDGRVALAGRTKATTILRIYTRDGALQREVTMPVREAWIVGERTDGKLLLLGFNTVTREPNGRGRTMFLVDLNRGTIDRTLPDVRGPVLGWSPDPRLVRYDANAKLAAVDASGKLMFWN